MTSAGKAAAWAGLQRVGIGAAVVGLGTLAAGAALDPTQLFRSYLLGYVWVIGMAFGCLPLAMLHALTGGRWGAAIRRPLYAALSTLPLFVVLFVPIFLGAKRLYPWTDHATTHLHPGKAIYLSLPMFGARTVVYFAAWLALATLLYRRATLKRRRLDPTKGTKAMRVLSGPGLLVCGLTMSFAAFDWLMSLEPHWFSTMFGLWIVVGQLLSAMAFSVLLLAWLTLRGDEAPDAGQLLDLGNLLTVFVMVWGYVSFSQFLIIYAGNIAEDASYFVHRTEHGWQYVGRALIVLHFVVPFVTLLSRKVKRSPRALAMVAAGLLAVRLVDLFWIVAPSSSPAFRLHWMDLAAPLGLGGVWLVVLSRRLARPELDVPAAVPAASH
jgi:hypothetical protein